MTTETVHAQSPNALTTIPSSHVFKADLHVQESIPIIDYSLFTSGSPEQRAKIVKDMEKACEEWGLFILTNHGVPESLMKSMIETCRRFSEFGEDEKKEYEGKQGLVPISYDSSRNICSWRDLLLVVVHPEFSSPNNPPEFRDVAMEYTKRIRFIARELLKGISASLGLQSNYIDNSMNMERCFQIMVSNFYPSCPQPDNAFGTPKHTDSGFFTLHIQDEIEGLQIQHNGKWFNVQAPPYSLIVHSGDLLEISSNGKYKSLPHRAFVNKVSRSSIAIAHGPSMDSVIGPAPELGRSNFASGVTLKEFLDLKFSNKPALDLVRVKGD